MQEGEFMESTTHSPILDALSGLSEAEKTIAERRYIRAEPVEITCENLSISRAKYEEITSRIVKQLRSCRVTGSQLNFGRSSNASN